MISYAQNMEDVILARLFKSQATGFYIDAGAWHPTDDSVTKHFYDLGWSGINVEPTPHFFRLLSQERPRDVNLNVALGRAPDVHVLYEFSETGFSTLNEGYREIFMKSAGAPSERRVEVKTLKDICAQYVKGDIDFLKVDVEGWESAVIEGNDWERYRPRVVLIESTWPNSAEETPADWEPYLLSRGYESAYFDGLNKFYVRREEPFLKKFFRTPPNIFDGFKPVSLARAEEQLTGALQSLSETRTTLAGITSERDRMIHSRSWRYTLPIRRLGRWFRCAARWMGWKRGTA